MANPIDETGARYISKLSMNGTAYTIMAALQKAAYFFLKMLKIPPCN